jgi:hypothetical protein
VFRQLILSAALATGTLTALSVMPATAEAAPPALLPHHHFEVLVQRGPQGWQSHGIYRFHAEAKLIALRLRHEGQRVEIREF